MNAREIEKKAFDNFGKWANQWRKDNPDEDVDTYTLALMYPDGKLLYNKALDSDGKELPCAICGCVGYHNNCGTT